MCFPSKKQAKLLAEDSPASKPSTTPKPQPPKEQPAPPAATSTTATTPAVTMSSPKVAIVIYTMYGHIAKRACPPSLSFSPVVSSDRASHTAHRTVAEAVKTGVESAGGAATIYQCVLSPTSRSSPQPPAALTPRRPRF